MSDHESDHDSLFGSPPPSPTGGRAVAGLALPGSGNEISLLSSQNVGTIALPGSQYVSELSNNPLASLSVYPRPPAPLAATESIRPSSAPANDPPSRQASVPDGVTSFASQHRARPSARRKRTNSPRRPPPEIPMPDPSQPLPANFLRNQSALLGTAGLVSGVRPMTLPQHNSRGHTAHNPIVIEEEEESNVRGQPAQWTNKISQKKSNPNKSSTLLPLPANDEIVDILIRQKNILPILQGILKLLKPKSSTPAPVPKPPATKKRKLNRVPAGAGDWDVPYPFAEGEGPKQYRETWEETRGRELILQLRKMISDATKTAATRRYLAQQERVRAEAYASGYQHGITAAAANGGQQQQHQTPTASANLPAEPSHPVAESSTFNFGSKQEDGVNALIASMLANSAQQGTGAVDRVGVTASQGDVDDWISILEAFPSQNEGLPPQVFMEPPMASLLPPVNSDAPGSSDQGSASPANFSAPPAFFDHNFDQTMNGEMSTLFPQYAEGGQANADVQMGNVDFEAFMMTLQNTGSTTSPAGPGDGLNGDSSMTLTTALPTPIQPIPDTLIDPALVSLSLFDYSHIQSFVGTPSLSRESSIPLLSASPMPSMSDMEPLTPNSAGWEASVPDVFGEERMLPSRREGGGQGMWRQALWNSMIAYDGNFATDYEGHSLDEVMQLSEKAKGKRKQPGNTVPEHLPWPSINMAIGGRAATIDSAAFIPASTQPFVVSDKLTKRSEILRRARERQKQLADEIVRVRGELWETTIEQGVLAQLAHHYNSSSEQN